MESLRSCPITCYHTTATIMTNLSSRRIYYFMLTIALFKASAAFQQQQRHFLGVPHHHHHREHPRHHHHHRFLSTPPTPTAFFATTASNTPRRRSSSSSSDSKYDIDDDVEAPHVRKRDKLIPRAVKLYADYASRLWNETNPDVRMRLASDKAVRMAMNLRQLLREEDVMDTMSTKKERQKVIDACDHFLETAESSKKEGAATAKPVAEVVLLEHEDVAEEIDLTDLSALTKVEDKELTATALSSGTDDEAKEQQSSAVTKPKKKKRRSVWFGAAMGLVVACWVFSGNYIFTGLFTLMTILGQLEYYRMVINTGVYPARRISVVGACSMFLTALFTPDLHQICLPMFGLWSMIWFLTMKRSVTTIPEIAATFTGMFYLGYVPSFWVRVRISNSGRELTRLAPWAGPLLARVTNYLRNWFPESVVQWVHLPITTGAIFIFWTWLCLAFSDVGAYFVGKSFGKTKLGRISPAAGATSPNKTVEGVLGGCAVSSFLAIIGAWVQKWPYPVLTGAIHGSLLGLLGLIGDLTASMLKRDAGLKDFGDLIPEHGGIMDRVDSFVWSAPYSWLVCCYIIPALKNWFR